MRRTSQSEGEGEGTGEGRLFNISVSQVTLLFHLREVVGARDTRERLELS